MTVTEDVGRLVDVVEGRFEAAAAVDGALAVGSFLSEVEVVLEDMGRLAGTEPAAAALLGRVLAAAAAAAVALVAPAAGCDAGPRQTGAMEGKIRRESKEKKKIRKMSNHNSRGG